MARLKVTCAFLGYHFEGWQKMTGKRTIQATLEAIVSRINDDDVSIVGCGRTDKHVSADQYVFHVDVSKKMTPAQWLKGLNAHCPPDIRILNIESVDEHFHARFSALSKCYEYRLRYQNYNVKTYMIESYHRYAIDIPKMQAAAQSFYGTHDFTGFNVTPKVLKANQIRTIEHIELVADEECIYIRIISKAFLQYQVRMMVGALIAIGAGKQDIGFIAHVLQAKQKGLSHYKAEAKGLTLKEVYYD